jgi:hypothetical protein
MIGWIILTLFVLYACFQVKSPKKDESVANIIAIIIVMSGGIFWATWVVEAMLCYSFHHHIP